jgi:solute carrier family 25 S-adenosylmethionine transporter 26
MAFAGALATMIGDLAMHPVDCIKTLQQSSRGASLSMLGASREILRTQGLSGFYSGAGTYVTTDGVAGSLKFATYEFLKRKWDAKCLTVQDTRKRERMQTWGVFAIAGAAFLASSVVLVPGELIKQRLQLGQIDSVGQGIASILKNEGIGGLFTGYSGVCFRDVPYTMMELGLYDNLKRGYLRFKQRRSDASNGEPIKISQFDEMLCAALTGGITGYLSNPLDIVKTKMMTDAAYGGFFTAFRQQVKQYGAASLFQGGVARVAWLMPFTAIYLPIYEEIKRTLLMARTKKQQQKSALELRGGAQQMKCGRMCYGHSESRPGICFV